MADHGRLFVCCRLPNIRATDASECEKEGAGGGATASSSGAGAPSRRRVMSLFTTFSCRDRYMWQHLDATEASSRPAARAEEWSKQSRVSWWQVDQLLSCTSRRLATRQAHGDIAASGPNAARQTLSARTRRTPRHGASPLMTDARAVLVSGRICISHLGVAFCRSAP